MYGLIKLFYRTHIAVKSIVGQLLFNATVYRNDFTWCKAAKGEGLVPSVIYIGVGRFRILGVGGGGGQGLEYWGGARGGAAIPAGT